MNWRIGFLFKGDKVIWMVLLIFCMISIVEVFSASSVLTYKSQDYLRPIVFHSFTIIVGVVVAIIIQNIPYSYFRLMIPSLLLFSCPDTNIIQDGYDNNRDFVKLRDSFL